MNYAIVFRLLSYILFCEAALLLLPATASLCYGEWSVLGVFAFTAALCLVLGLLLRRIKPSSKVFYMREGFATTALSWVVISIMGAIPFVLTGCIPNPVDAMFETVSGFTTTGASILPAVEGLPKGVLFWRSFTNWVGGMGVLVFMMAVLPLADDRSMHIMRAEVPGPVVGKLVPKARQSAMILYGIYVVISILEVVFLMAGGMPLYDALVSTFATAGTGGFSVKNASIAGYNSPYAEYVISVFLLLFSINFNLYFFILLRNIKPIFKNEELRWFLGIVAASVIAVAVNIRNMYPTVEEIIRKALFQVASIISTAGFSTADFDRWPELSRSILVCLMLIGACAGSTGGGIKVSRLLILGKTLGKELKQALHPQVVAPVRMDGKLLNHETIRTTNVFMGAYFFIFVVSFLLISLDGFDMVTNFTAIAATLNNIGPGLAQVGPMMNFGSFTNPAKLVMIFDMLAGRLEIFPMLVLFLPDTWRRF